MRKPDQSLYKTIELFKENTNCAVGYWEELKKYFEETIVIVTEVFTVK